MNKQWILGTLGIAALAVTLIVVGGRGAQADVRAASGAKSVGAPVATLVVTSTADITTHISVVSDGVQDNQTTGDYGVPSSVAEHHITLQSYAGKMVAWDPSDVSAIMVHDQQAQESDPEGIFAWDGTNGLYGGVVTHVAINPLGHIFAGTYGAGVFRSTDNGQNWIQVHYSSSLDSVNSLAINSSGHIFAGYWGLFRSTDNGDTWVSTGLTNINVVAVAINSSDHVFAGTLGRGILYSMDNGETWAQTDNGLPASGYWVSGITINSLDHLFVATDQGIFRSTDDGANWTEINNGLTNTSAGPLAINSFDHIFAGTGGWGQDGGIFRSTDNGETWTQINDGLTNTTVPSLVINPSDDIFAGTWRGGIFRSTDNGETWQNVGLDNTAIRSLAVNALGHVFAGSDGEGVFRSEDNGATWPQINNGLANAWVRSLAASPLGHTFAATWNDGIFRSTDDGANWSNVGLTKKVFDSIIVNSSGHIFAGANDIFRSTDGGETWTQMTSDLTNLVQFLAINPSGHIFAATQSGVFRSTDNGETWTQVNTGLTSTNITALAINSSGHVFVGAWSATGGVFRSTDNGETWVDVGLANIGVRSLAINSSDHIFAGTRRDGVFRSADNGDTWVNVGLANVDGYSLAIDPSGRIFVGTLREGVFLSTDNGETWTQTNTGLGNMEVESLVINSSGDALAGTNGGVFRSINRWTNYTSGANVIALADDGNYMMVGSFGGLTRLDKTTGDMTHYNSANSGLPDNMTTAIAKDVNGDWWIGTDNGLAKFDGTNWTVYRSDNSPLSRNDISCLAIDAEGNKWIGVYRGGLVKFDGTNWTVYNTENSGLPEDAFRSIVIDSEGNKWLGTNGGGLAKFDGTDWTVYDTSNSDIPGNYISSIAIDMSGNKWIGFCGGDSGGFTVFDGNTWTNYNTDNSPLENDCVRHIAIDNDGIKWVGVHNQGVIEFDGANWTIHDTGSLGMVAEVNQFIIIDSVGDKWVGGFGGLAKYDGTDWSIYDVGNSGLPYNYVLSIAFDEEGNKWIGTHFAGLSRFDGTNWSVYLEGIPDRHVFDIVIDGENNKWVLTGDGLSKFDGTNWTVYNSGNSGLPEGGVTSLAIDADNNLWMVVYDSATESSSLVKFDGADWTVYDLADSGLQFGYESYLAIDANGTVWVGTIPSWDGSQMIGGGLAKFDGTTWTVYDTSNSDLPSNSIYGLAIDADGNVWLGTLEGLAKFDGTNWAVYDSSNSPLPSNSISYLDIDADGSIWSISKSWDPYSQFIAKFDGTNWTIFNLDNSGLPNRRLVTFRVDRDGGLWIATWGGLGLFYPSAYIVTSSADSGPGTLRQAMLDAQTGDTIHFDLTVFPPTSPVTIALTTALPGIDQGNLTIDASNAGVILDGSGTPEGTDGFHIGSSGNIIKGLQILNFPSDGIEISDGPYQNNTIGGNRAIGNGPAGEGNVLSDNGDDGIEISGTGADSNIVSGNLIGTDVSGAIARGNGGTGVRISAGASNNFIGGSNATPGGACSGECNLISGNVGTGVSIEGSGTMSNTVSGNYIGTNINGTTALGNESDGVRLDDGPEFNTIGSLTSGERNLISGNGRDGVELAGTHNNSVIGNYIGTDVSGMFSLGNSERGIGMNEGGRGLATTQNNIEGNLMSGNGTNGMDIYGADTVSNTVKGNLIGTDATGLSALANGGTGIWIGACAHHNKIGGHVEADRNVISGNGSNGIRVYGEGGDCADFNQILGNYIGVAANGLDALGNDSVGILPSNVIGTHIEGNVIANNRWGIWLSGVTSSTVRANLIGVNAASTPAGNEYQGIHVGYFAHHNTIGGPNPADGNVIAHNSTGVQVWSYYGETYANTISHNSIYSNTNLGIDLHGGANKDIVAPLVATVNMEGGIASGTACANCTVEIFFDAGDQGRWYAGTTIASGTGDWSFSNGTAFIGPNVHATATDANGNTSEFSGPPPIVSSVSPVATVPGAKDLGITINGDHFRDNEPLAVGFGARVTVMNTQFISRTQIHLYLDVDPGAALGPRDVSVTNYDGQSGVGAGMFEIVSTSPFNPPTISTVLPEQVAAIDQTISLIITGDDFVDLPAVSIHPGAPEISVEKVIYAGDTRLKVDIHVWPTTTLGVVDLTVTNPDQQTAILGDAFEIVAPLFTDVAHSLGLDVSSGELGAAWGDLDSNGWLDLVIGDGSLFTNTGGSFSNATAAADLDPVSDHGGVAWGDYDNDGDLDLLSSWSKIYRQDSLPFAKVWDDGVYTAPPLAWVDYDLDSDLDAYAGGRLYRNDGGDAFTDVTDSAGLSDENLLASVWADYDNDGDPDLYATCNVCENRLYRNNGDGTFSDVTGAARVGGDEGSGHGAAWGDYDNDGDLDLFVANNNNEYSILYRNNGDGTFQDVSAVAGLLDRLGFATGANWLDYNLDGWLDIFVVNRDGENRLYHNNGDGSFSDIGAVAGVADSRDSDGSTVGDYDNDGDPDIYVVSGIWGTGTPNFLFQNGANPGAGGPHWLKVKLEGTRSNRSAIGAVVRITGGGPLQTRQLAGSTGYMSQDALEALFGFGSYTGTVDVEVTWPGNIQQSLHDVTLDQILIIAEETASISRILPNQGTNDVPSEINIYGLNFAEGISVTLGTTPLTNLDTWRLGSSHLRATVPAGLPAGTYDLTVTNPDGGSDTLANAYSVFDVQVENDDLYAQNHDLWIAPPSIRQGEQTNLGLVVHRQGGKTTLSNVTVRFYNGDPDGGGAVIGDGTIYLLSPRSSESTTRVPWIPPVAGNYVIYARIDPDDAISETIETNNTVSAAITVLPPAGDTTSPMVTAFTINNGAEMTAVPTVTLDVSAEDDVGGSGMGSVFFVEFEFVQAAMQWVPVQASGWLSYTTNYTWTLIPVAGVKYIQAWAADRAGNISLYPYKDRINFLLPSDGVAMGQVRLYRQYIGAGQTLTVIVNPISGDPDLYVWPPAEGAPAWVSNSSTGADQLNIVAMQSGTYQIEVYGYSTARYTISIGVSGGGAGLVTEEQAIQSVNADKPLRPVPMIPVSNEPPGQMAIPAAPVTGDVHKIYLPLIMRQSP